MFFAGFRHPIFVSLSDTSKFKHIANSADSNHLYDNIKSQKMTTTKKAVLKGPCSGPNFPGKSLLTELQTKIAIVLTLLS